MKEDLNILKDFPPQSHADWLAAVDEQLKGKPFDKMLVKKTYEGINIQPMYFQHDLEGLDHVDTLPGELPYVRGTTGAGSVVNVWNIAQEITDADPEEFNKAARNDLSRGQNALNLVFDKATLSGSNPDQAPTSAVGQGGLSVATTEDLEKAFNEIDITKLPTQVHSGLSGIALTALLAAFLQKQGKSIKDLKGCIAMDPFGVLAVEGKLPFSLEQAYNEMAQLTLWSKDNASELQTIAVHADPYQNSGGNAVQEVAFGMATAVEYIRAMRNRGFLIDDIASRIMFVFSIGADFFMEIAKFRAARMVWCQVVESFGGNEESRKMKIHARTSRWNKTKVDPWVNMLRVSTEAFSGIAGGIDSMHVGPFDEIIHQPNEFSRRIARNVHIVLKEEAHFDKVVDPAGGCWYVESITAELAQKIWKLFQDIESIGGMFNAIKEGVPQSRISEIATQRAKNIATRTDRFVGTNMYPNMSEKAVTAKEFDHSTFQRNRTDQVAQFISLANKPECISALIDMSKNQCEISGKVVANAIQAALAGATLGDLTKALRPEPGAEVTVNPVNIHRGAEGFENLRRAIEAYTAQKGERPKLFLANMGPIPQHKARADFSTAFFNVGAFEAIGNNGFETIEEAADAALASGARAVVICSTDATYPDLVPPLTKRIKTADPGIMVILAGYPKEHVETFKEAGIDEFLHIRSNALELLGKLQKHLGVIS